MRIEYDFKTGEATEFPDDPSPLSRSDLQKIEMDALDAELRSNLDTLTIQYTRVLLADGTSEEAKVAAIRDQQTAIKTKYQADYLALVQKYKPQPA